MILVKEEPSMPMEMIIRLTMLYIDPNIAPQNIYSEEEKEVNKSKLVGRAGRQYKASVKKANTDVRERSGMYVDSDAWLDGGFDANDETAVDARAIEFDVSVEAAADFVAADK
ncbi:hypothetical protein BVC80_8819g12 [Macleaya cordata]|uniref:Uncharacterized protein n=1 Tax=Macleaya cordata TaxID=56857 RepID=A0A200PSD9_MACCD|nr:hypothetical protein BVC80_8819g12 [Macleaya cordata]